MITTTLVLSIVTAVASAVAAYFLGRMDGAESTRARYSSMMSNLNSELENLISSVKTEAGVSVEPTKEEFTTPAEPTGKGSEVTELPAAAVIEDRKVKTTTANKKQTPKRKKGKK